MSRVLSLLVALVACAAACAPANATSLIVPDDSPTIQGALDAHPDTVLVRGGSYQESPVLYARVALLGIPGGAGFERPVVSGMTLGSSWTSPGFVADFLVRDVEFGGQVYIHNQDGSSQVVLDHCRLQAGIQESSESPESSQLTLRGCVIDQDVLYADGFIVVDDCIFRGGHLVVAGDDCDLTVTNSEFHGDGTRSAIAAVNGIHDARITGNLLEGYGGGIFLEVTGTVRIEDNVLRDMQASGMGLHGASVHVIRNKLERCIGRYSYGINAEGTDALVVTGNTIANCGGSGMLAIVSSQGTIVDNVVWGCGFYGIHLGGDAGGLLEVKNNTSCLNGLNGFQSECWVNGGRYEFEGNIGFGNGRYGVEWGVPEVSAVRCNDWFGNGLGAVSGLPMSSEDRSVDPQFCNAANGDFRLASTSPLVSPPGCGQVGALGVGCTGTSRLTVLGQNPSRGPVRIEFELGVPAAIEIDVFDLQGRRVASLAHGTWPAGTHAVEWAGRSGSTRLAVGMYVVRYRHPGGEDKRRIVLTP